MKYLGIEPQKPKIGVFDFTCCEGCELQLANKENTLLDFLSLIEIVNFREVSSDISDNYDIALIEGSITRKDEVERVTKIRKHAKILVALGSCACYGGVNFQKNQFSLRDVISEVYGNDTIDTSKVKKVSDVVKVDLEIPGCPISKAEVEKLIINIVLGVDNKIQKYPVCVECKHKINNCVVDLGKICLGPVTRAGCGGVCPSFKVGCLGCRGPAEGANFDSLFDIFINKGFSKAEISERLNFYNGFHGAKYNEN